MPVIAQAFTERQDVRFVYLLGFAARTEGRLNYVLEHPEFYTPERLRQVVTEVLQDAKDAQVE